MGGGGGGDKSVNFAFEITEELSMSPGVSVRVGVDVRIAWFSRSIYAVTRRCQASYPVRGHILLSLPPFLTAWGQIDFS